MDANINFKNTIVALCSGALMFVAGALACPVGWLMAALMTVGIALMGIGGSCFIRITWMKIDRQRKKNQWREFDFGQIC